MATKRKEIPVEDVSIMGLKTLRDKKWSQEAMAEYYSKKLHVPISRWKVGRKLAKLAAKESEDNAGHL